MIVVMIIAIVGLGYAWWMLRALREERREMDADEQELDELDELLCQFEESLDDEPPPLEEICL